MKAEEWKRYTRARTAKGLYARHIGGEWCVASGLFASARHSMIEEPTVLEARALLRMPPGRAYTRVAVHAFIRETGTVEDCEAISPVTDGVPGPDHDGYWVCPLCTERIGIPHHTGAPRPRKHFWHTACLERVQQRQWLTCCECGDRIARREECSPKGDVTCGPCFHDKRGSTHYDQPTTEKAPNSDELERLEEDAAPVEPEKCRVCSRPLEQPEQRFYTDDDPHKPFCSDCKAEHDGHARKHKGIIAQEPPTDCGCKPAGLNGTGPTLCDKHDPVMRREYEDRCTRLERERDEWRDKYMELAADKDDMVATFAAGLDAAYGAREERRRVDANLRSVFAITETSEDW